MGSASILRAVGEIARNLTAEAVKRVWVSPPDAKTKALDFPAPNFRMETLETRQLLSQLGLTVDNPPNGTYNEGDPVAVTATFNGDGTQTPDRYVFNWGDGTETYATSTTTLSLQHSFNEEGNPHQIDATVYYETSYEEGGSYFSFEDSATGSAQVAVSEGPLTLSVPGDMTVNAHQLVDVSPSLSDGEINHTDPTSYTVNWGDTTGDSAGTGPFHHAYGSAGTYTVNVTGTHGDDSQSNSFTVTVQSYAAQFSSDGSGPANEGDNFEVQTTFTPGSDYPDESPASYLINWGDGNTQTFLSGPFSHTYVEESTYAITGTMYTNQGNSYAISATAPISEGPVTVAVPGDTTISVGETVDLSPSLSDGETFHTDPTVYTVNWGDGTSSSGSDLPFHHTYGSIGTYAVNVTGSHGDDAATNTFDVSVTYPPSVTTGDGTPINEGDTFPLTVTFHQDSNYSENPVYYVVDWGDNSFNANGGNGGGETIWTSDLTHTFSHVYAEDLQNGAYYISVTVHTDQGHDYGTNTDAFVNEAPYTFALSDNSTAYAGETYSLFTNITGNTDGEDPRSFEVDWGDGTIDQVTAQHVGTSDNYTHIYSDPGTYHVKVDGYALNPNRYANSNYGSIPSDETYEATIDATIASVPSESISGQIGVNSHARVDIHGVPLPDPSPTGEGESDRIPNMASVDMYTLTPSFSTNDVAVPLPGGDLNLEFRRTEHTDSRVLNYTSKDLEVNHRWASEGILGPGWSTNLAAHVLITDTPDAYKSGQATTTAAVVDDVGNSINYTQGVGWVPDVANNFANLSLRNKLEDVGVGGVLLPNGQRVLPLGGYVYTEEYGTKLYFEFGGDITHGDGLNPPTSTETYYRLANVVDRNGNVLNYSYDGAPDPTLVTAITDPSTDALPQKRKLQLSYKIMSGGVGGEPTDSLNGTIFRLDTLTDPLGRIYRYHYAGDPDQPVRADGATGLLVAVEKPVPNGPVNATGGPEVTFDYYDEGFTAKLEIKTDGSDAWESKNYIDWILPKTITDARSPVTGNTTTFDYTPKLEPSSIQLKKGSIVGVYEVRYLLSSVQTADGTATFQEASSGDLRSFTSNQTQVTDTRGATTQYNFGADTDPHQAISEIVPAPNNLGFAIVINQVVRSTSGFSAADSGSVTYHFSSDINLDLTSVTDLNGNTISYQYNSGLNPSADPYNAAPYGGLFRNWYALDGKPSSRVIDPGNSPHLNLSTIYSYDVLVDATGNPLHDASGNEIVGFHKLARQVDPGGNVTVYGFDAHGNRVLMTVAATTAVAATSHYSYDSRGFMTEKVDPDGRTTDFTANTFGNLADTIVDPGGLHLVTQRAADVMDNTTSSTDPNGNVTSYAIDNWNRVTDVTPPAVVDPVPSAAHQLMIHRVYDNNSNLQSEKDQNGNLTTYVYDAFNRVTEKRRVMGATPNDAVDLITRYTYDPVGLLATQTDPNGNVTTHIHDALLRETETSEQVTEQAGAAPVTYATFYQYGNLSGENSGSGAFILAGFSPTRVIDPRGFATDTVYDAAYRPIRKIRRMDNGAGVASTDPARAGDLETDTIYSADGKAIETIVHNETAAGSAANRITYTFFDHQNRPTVSVVALTGLSVNSNQFVDDPVAFVANPANNMAGDLVTQTQYDAAGNPQFTTDPNGNKTETVYDAAGRPTDKILRSPIDIFTASGGVHHYDGSATNSLTLSHTVYDSNGNEIQVTDANGNSTLTEYDARNRATRTASDLNGSRTIDVGDIVTSVSYDLNGNKVFSTNPNGIVTEFTYDADNRLTRSIVDFNRDSAFDPTQGVNATDAVTSSVYDKNGNIVSVIDPLGLVAETTYDELNRARINISNANAASGAADRLVTETRYDADGNIIATVKQNWVNGVMTPQVTSYQFDAFGRKTSITQSSPDGIAPQPVTSFAYDAAGDVLTQTDPRNHTTAFAYDRAGRKTQMTQPAVDAGTPTTTYGYDLDGNLTSVTDPLAHTMRYTYDALNRKTRQILPDPGGSTAAGPTTTFNYDAAGNLTRVIDPRSTVSQTIATETVYDRANRKTSVHQPDPATGDPTSANAPVTNFAYDAAGNLTSATDAIGHVTSYAYDALNRRTSVTQPDPGTGSPITSYTYDLDGNLLAVTDPLIHTTAFAYDGLNRKISMTQPDPVTGNPAGVNAPVTSYAYDPVGNLLGTTDPLTHTTSYAYDLLNRKTSMIRPDATLGQGTTYRYDANGNVTSVTDPLLTETTYEYDALNRKTTVTQPNPGSGSPVTRYAYDLDGNLTSTTDPLTHVTSYAYDALNRKIAMTQPDPVSGVPGTGSPVTTYAYDADNNLTSTADPRHFVTRYVYDDLNRKIEEFLPNPSGASSPDVAPTSYAYDAVGNLTLTVDPRGGGTEYLYDALNRKVTMRQADPATGDPTLATSPLTSYAYDAAGNLTSTTDPLAHTTSYAYDALNRKTTMTQPDPVTGVAGPGSPVTMYAYDKAGNVTAITDPMGYATLYAYDTVNRKTSVTQPDPATGLTDAGSPVTHYTYDLNGNLTSTTDPLNHATSYAYDVLNRKTSMTLPATAAGASVTTYAYDAAGNLTGTTDPLAHVTSYDYDALNRKIRMTQPPPTTGAAAPVTTYAYDASGNLTAMTDPDANTTTYTYDARNRQLTDTNQLGQSDSTAYDLNNNVISDTDRDGRTRRFEYDYLNRKTAELWVDSTNTVIRAIISTYDAAGRLTQISDPDSTFTYTYDALNRLLISDNAGTISAPRTRLSESYNQDGDLTAIAAFVNDLSNWSFSNVYSYDALNRQTRVIQSGPNISDKRADFSYDAAGNMLGIQRYNDRYGTLAIAKSDYVYDVQNQLIGLTHKQGNGVGTATLNDYTWTPDAAARVTSAVNSDGSTSYSYDADNQLLSAAHTNTAITNEAYNYDANGNRITSTSGTGASGTYATGPDNRLTSDGTYSYTYDNEGNPLIRTTIATGETLAYGWDYRNRLVGLSYQDSTGHVTQQVLYTYDTSDRRISKQVSYGSAIVGKYVFYNNSSYDGYDPNAVASTDANAIAPDKQALLPNQTATPFNFTNYDKGINGVVIDVTGLPTGATLTAADFGFLAGNTNNPSTWTSTPSPSIVSVFPGAGVNGSDRIELIWTDYTIRNQWLQVTVKADSNTALQGPQVFYFGNLVAETGHGSSGGVFLVNIGDVVGTKFHSGTSASITSWFDFNRDGQTGIFDVNTVKFDQGHSLVALNAPDMPKAGFEAYVYGPNSSSDDLLLVVDSTTAVTHRILEGPQPHMVLADEDTSKLTSDPNRVQWLLGDNQQTVRDQVNDAGTLTDHLVYDSYGNVVTQTPGASAPRFQYTGMQADNESGMLFDFRRYYDPKTGRFISQDPKSFAAGDTNLYRYVGNNPINRIDPTGLVAADNSSNAGAMQGDNGMGFSSGGSAGDFNSGGGSSTYTGPRGSRPNDGSGSTAAQGESTPGTRGTAPENPDPWPLRLGTGPGTVGDLLALPNSTFGSGASKFTFIAPEKPITVKEPTFFPNSGSGPLVASSKITWLANGGAILEIRYKQQTSTDDPSVVTGLGIKQIYVRPDANVDQIRAGELSIVDSANHYAAAEGLANAVDKFRLAGVMLIAAPLVAGAAGFVGGVGSGLAEAGGVLGTSGSMLATGTAGAMQIGTAGLSLYGGYSAGQSFGSAAINFGSGNSQQGWLDAGTGAITLGLGLYGANQAGQGPIRFGGGQTGGSSFLTVNDPATLRITGSVGGPEGYTIQNPTGGMQGSGFTEVTNVGGGLTTQGWSQGASSDVFGNGTSVTRNWGGQSGPFGQSWTTDPVTIQSRNSLGLETTNTAEFVSHGTVMDNTGITTRSALAWGRFAGGGQETLFEPGTAQNQIQLNAVTMPDNPLPWSLSSDPRPLPVGGR